MSEIVLDNVTKTHRSLGRPAVRALDAVTWTIPAGQITGLVGESGSGKTTLVRCITGLENVDSGRIRLGETVLQPSRRGRPAHLRRRVQLVFQDPTSSLDPRMTVGQLIEEGIHTHRLRPTGITRRARVTELLRLVGLDPRDAQRYPHSFSGGQRQRVAIARALAVEPDVLICDEPVSALDVSVQAQILNLLHDMQQQLGLTVLFVAHDLAVVRQLCARVAVLDNGSLIEQGTSQAVLDHPQHPYTRALLAAAPMPDPVAARAERQRRLAISP